MKINTKLYSLIALLAACLACVIIFFLQSVSDTVHNCDIKTNKPSPYLIPEITESRDIDIIRFHMNKINKYKGYHSLKHVYDCTSLNKTDFELLIETSTGYFNYDYKGFYMIVNDSKCIVYITRGNQKATKAMIAVRTCDDIMKASKEILNNKWTVDMVESNMEDAPITSIRVADNNGAIVYVGDGFYSQPNMFGCEKDDNRESCQDYKLLSDIYLLTKNIKKVSIVDFLKK